MNRKPKLGERLVAEVVRRSGSEIVDVEVTRVGTKYFDVKVVGGKYKLTTNLIRDWRVREGGFIINHNDPIRIYETRDQIAVKNEHQQRAAAIGNKYRYGTDWLTVDPDKLKTITEILGL